MPKRKKRTAKTTVHNELAKLENGIAGDRLKQLGDLLEKPISGGELEAMYEAAGFTQIGISAATGIKPRTMRSAVYSAKVRKPIELAVRYVLHIVELYAEKRRLPAQS